MVSGITCRVGFEFRKPGVYLAGTAAVLTAAYGTYRVGQEAFVEGGCYLSCSILALIALEKKEFEACFFICNWDFNFKNLRPLPSKNFTTRK